MARVFEDLSNQYLLDLSTNGTIVNGQLIGVSEDFVTSTAKVTMIINGEAHEKFIIIYKVNDVMTWMYFNKADNVLDYAYSTDNWSYPTFIKRIVAPIVLTLQYPQFEVWFRLNNLPIVVKNKKLYCYCTTILPEHQALVDSLSGVITIEDKP